MWAVQIWIQPESALCQYLKQASIAQEKAIRKPQSRKQKKGSNNNNNIISMLSRKEEGINEDAMHVDSESEEYQLSHGRSL